MTEVLVRESLQNENIRLSKTASVKRWMNLSSLAEVGSVAYPSDQLSDEWVIKPTALLESGGDSFETNLAWYNWWVHQQVKNQPEELFSVVKGFEKDNEQMWLVTFASVWREVWSKATTTPQRPTLDEIVMHLLQKEYLVIGATPSQTHIAKNLVFAILGWQTMLYRPDMGSCTSSHFAIVDETDGYRGQAHMCLRHSQAASKAALNEFLLGFGVMLPCRNFGALASEENKKAMKRYTSVSANTFNAQLLASLCGVHIVWTSSLACHLEFDQPSNKLYIFRYPSFCTIHLSAEGQQHLPKATLYACAAALTVRSHWATPEEAHQMLREVLLSYRLLFGQSKTSRRFFNSLRPFGNLSQEGKDKSLTMYCGRKQCHLPCQLKEQGSYDLMEDFPILRSRIAPLMHHLSIKRPRTWKELWHDRRDSASWLTFWTVLVIGGIGMVLALIQVILQGIQVNLTLKQIQ